MGNFRPWCFCVAPFAGSVDWSYPNFNLKVGGDLSLPSLGAWIEVYKSYKINKTNNVAPFAGSVDWSKNGMYNPCILDVAPFAGSVDWSLCYSIILHFPKSRSLRWERGLKLPVKFIVLTISSGRSLRWERGLKFWKIRWMGRRAMSLPSLGAWIEVR